MVKADLHTHSTASDGTVAPSDIANLARTAGVTCVSLTDHDTLSGIAPAKVACDAASVIFIPGVEISVYSGENEVHLLGYGIKDTQKLSQVFGEIRAQREARMHHMLEKLARLGISIAYTDVACQTKNSVGRAHLAHVLCEKGHVHSMREAFDVYLSPGKSAYVPREKFTIRQAIELLLDAGALPVLAHPGQIPMSDMTLQAGMDRWRRYGLSGIEVYHPGHTPQTCAYFDRWARKRDMLITGGSDYHGSLKPQITLGDGVKYWDKMQEDVSRLLAAIPT